MEVDFKTINDKCKGSTGLYRIIYNKKISTKKPTK